MFCNIYLPTLQERELRLRKINIHRYIADNSEALSKEKLYKTSPIKYKQKKTQTLIYQLLVKSIFFYQDNISHIKEIRGID